MISPRATVEVVFFFSQWTKRAHFLVAACLSTTNVGRFGIIKLLYTPGKDTLLLSAAKPYVLTNLQNVETIERLILLLCMIGDVPLFLFLSRDALHSKVDRLRLVSIAIDKLMRR
jgi:hypothetical protein